MIKSFYVKQFNLALVNNVKWFQVFLSITNNSIKHSFYQSITIQLHTVEWSNSYFSFVRVFANGPGDLGSIPGRVIPKTLKMELDTTLLNTQHYKVRFKGKVEQSREWSSAPPLHLGVVAIEKGAFGSPSTMVANFTLLYAKQFHLTDR